MLKLWLSAASEGPSHKPVPILLTLFPKLEQTDTHTYKQCLLSFNGSLFMSRIKPVFLNTLFFGAH